MDADGWIKVGTMFGVPMLILAGIAYGFYRGVKWGAPHADSLIKKSLEVGDTLIDFFHSTKARLAALECAADEAKGKLNLIHEHMLTGGTSPRGSWIARQETKS